uniref:Uncharacterized protein n=1 Tax=Anguilla anguilla TaxID=7936 RepID=A0A0E9SD29_ANGAN
MWPLKAPWDWGGGGITRLAKKKVLAIQHPPSQVLSWELLPVTALSKQTSRHKDQNGLIT